MEKWIAELIEQFEINQPVICLSKEEYLRFKKAVECPARESSKDVKKAVELFNKWESDKHFIYPIDLDY